MVVAHGGATLALHPGPEDELKISYTLDYGPGSPIDAQTHTQTITPEVRVRDALTGWDIEIYRATAAGVTAANILHGSANAIGGTTLVFRVWYAGGGSGMYSIDLALP